MLLTLFIATVVVVWLAIIVTVFCPLRAARRRATEALPDAGD